MRMTCNDSTAIRRGCFSSIVLLQAGCLAAALLMLLTFWSDDQIGMLGTWPLCLTFTFQVAWSFWSWRTLTGRWLDGYTVFLTALCLFNGGQFLLETFDLNRKGMLYSEFCDDTINRTLLLVIASVAAFHLGGVCCAMKEVLDTEKQIVGSQHLIQFSFKRAKIIGLLFLIGALPVSCVKSVETISVAMASGYMSLFQQELDVGIDNWQMVLCEFLMPGILITLAMFRKSQRCVGCCWGLALLYAAGRMAIGSRTSAMLVCAPMVILHHTVVKRIRSVYLVIGCVAVVAAMPLIALTRDTTMEGRLDVLEKSVTDNLFVSAIAEMGGSAITTAYVVELVPKVRGYDWGASYMYGLLAVVPNLFWDRHPTAEHGALAIWLIWTVDPGTARIGGGLGFSVIAEAYANFGILGPPIVLAGLGWLLAAVAAWARSEQSPFPAAIEAVLLGTILVLVRGESASVFRPVMWFVGIPWLFALEGRGWAAAGSLKGLASHARMSHVR